MQSPTTSRRRAAISRQSERAASEIPQQDAGAESDPVLPYGYVSEAASHASPDRRKSEYRFELLTVQCRMANSPSLMPILR